MPVGSSSLHVPAPAVELADGIATSQTREIDAMRVLLG
jgi:hypothetical protein